MSGSTSEAAETDIDVERLKNRLNRLEEHIEHVYEPKIEEQAERIDDFEATVNKQAEQIEALEARVDGVISVDDNSESTPDRRASALREAMIRASGDSAGSISGGVTWWWEEVRDQLKTHGHGDFSKPTYHTAMKDAAEADGFSETSKDVISGNQRREVKAISVNPDEVTRPDLRNQLTTRVGGEDASTATSTDQESDT